MPRGEKLDAETVERIRELRAAGKTVKEITEEVGCGKSTVGRICQRGTSQINKEFDDAVNQMIAEAKEQEPVTQKNMLHSTEIPDDVLTAVRDAIDYEDETVEDHLRTIRELQHEVEQRRTKAAIMRKWLEDCGYESTAD